VEKAIIAAPKLKIKSKNIEIIDTKTLHILPVDTTRGNMYFSLQ
jgi:DNA-directed RNA polymerase III subunit RPC1